MKAWMQKRRLLSSRPSYDIPQTSHTVIMRLSQNLAILDCMSGVWIPDGFVHFPLVRLDPGEECWRKQCIQRRNFVLHVGLGNEALSPQSGNPTNRSWWYIRMMVKNIMSFVQINDEPVSSNIDQC